MARGRPHRSSREKKRSKTPTKRSKALKRKERTVDDEIVSIRENGFLTRLRVGCKVLLQFTMITALDYAPNFVRRKVLSGEYKGNALERRLEMKIGGGWRMLTELYRMARVNDTPVLAKGDRIPKLELYSLDGKMRRLPRPRNGRPLVINFGSCT